MSSVKPGVLSFPFHPRGLSDPRVQWVGVSFLRAALHDSNGTTKDIIQRAGARAKDVERTRARRRRRRRGGSGGVRRPAKTSFPMFLRRRKTDVSVRTFGQRSDVPQMRPPNASRFQPVQRLSKKRGVFGP